MTSRAPALRVLLACDKFKDTLSAREVERIIEEELWPHRASPPSHSGGSAEKAARLHKGTTKLPTGKSPPDTLQIIYCSLTNDAAIFFKPGEVRFRNKDTCTSYQATK